MQDVHNRIAPRRANTSKDQFTDDKIFNIATSTGSIVERAASENCSVSMVYKIDKRVRDTGDPNPAPRSRPGRSSRMSDTELVELFWLKSLQPSASISECVAFLKLLSNTDEELTRSTISRGF